MRAATSALRENTVQLSLSALAQQIEPVIKTGNILLLLGQFDLTGYRRSIIVTSNGILRAIALVIMTNHHPSRSVEKFTRPSVITA